MTVAAAAAAATATATATHRCCCCCCCGVRGVRACGGGPTGREREGYCAGPWGRPLLQRHCRGPSEERCLLFDGFNIGERCFCTGARVDVVFLFSELAQKTRRWRRSQSPRYAHCASHCVERHSYCPHRDSYCVQCDLYCAHRGFYCVSHCVHTHTPHKHRCTHARTRTHARYTRTHAHAHTQT